ncbi:hypothetical protein HELRODRAFT_180062 [Helobdella robusta]|uniref:Uncharacterized protein n=1 Tax=Helobdella robusta TaxID=6412 RepID=T1FFF4_HELRO|nr:hypothetical protein HELRODRAFT_180062 [Helobdella robusta]ESN94734.1 hypothetical protein HELRODRAFT_180062 [Helobdella robusta]
MFRSLLLIAVLAVFAFAVLSDYILVSAESDDHATQGISKRACPPFFVDIGKDVCVPLLPGYLDQQSDKIEEQLAKLKKLAAAMKLQLIFTTSKFILTKSIFPYIYSKEH